MDDVCSSSVYFEKQFNHTNIRVIRSCSYNCVALQVQTKNRRSICNNEIVAKRHNTMCMCVCVRVSVVYVSGFVGQLSIKR